jgi:hypothetical protein
MKQFSEWRDEKNTGDGIPNLPALSDAIRARLGSTTNYLRQSMGAYLPQEETIQESIQIEAEEALSERVTEEASLPQDTLIETAPISEEIPVDILNEQVDTTSDVYKLYRDREETFECNISVTGASLASAQARLIFDTNSINVIFYGKLYKDGRCLVPLQKMIMFPEGTRGQLRLEVVVDDTMFVPWESSCIVEGAKKVIVDVKQRKGVSINFEEPKTA